VTATVETIYLGFKVIVTHEDFTVLKRDGTTAAVVTSMRAARAIVRELRRTEREG
jgi:hypothetical protein